MKRPLEPVSWMRAVPSALTHRGLPGGVGAVGRLACHDVAGDLIRSDRPGSGRDLRALLDRQRTPEAEATSLARVDHLGRLSGVGGDQLFLVAWVGHRREEQLRVGVLWIGEDDSVGPASTR